MRASLTGFSYAERRAARLRGGHSVAGKSGWEKYTWKVHDEGTPGSVTRSQGFRAGLLPGQADGRFIARFDPQYCADCPCCENLCRVQYQQRVGRTLCMRARRIKGSAAALEAPSPGHPHPSAGLKHRPIPEKRIPHQQAADQRLDPVADDDLSCRRNGQFASPAPLSHQKGRTGPQERTSRWDISHL